jgi:hypothetical protein
MTYFKRPGFRSGKTMAAGNANPGAAFVKEELFGDADCQSAELPAKAIVISHRPNRGQRPVIETATRRSCLTSRNLATAVLCVGGPCG